MGKPADYVPPDAALIATAMGSGLLGTPGDEGVGAFPAAAGPDLSKATTVLLIKNMLSDSELGDEGECKEIAEDTIQKCNEDFGKVSALIIVRPGKEGLPDGVETGKVYVEFADIESCKKAASGLNQVTHGLSRLPGAPHTTPGGPAMCARVFACVHTETRGCTSFQVKFDDRIVETDFGTPETVAALKALYPEQLALIPEAA